MERITSRANAPHLCRPAGRVSVACFAAMLIAAGTAVPALAQATMRPQPSRQGPAASPDSKGQPHAPYHSSDMKHHRVPAPNLSFDRPNLPGLIEEVLGSDPGA